MSRSSFCSAEHISKSGSVALLSQMFSRLCIAFFTVWQYSHKKMTCTLNCARASTALGRATAPGFMKHQFWLDIKLDVCNLFMIYGGKISKVTSHIKFYIILFSGVTRSTEPGNLRGCYFINILGLKEDTHELQSEQFTLKKSKISLKTVILKNDLRVH